ncbi:hypothetical protein DGM98_10100 [Xanthomonas citri]|uniref:Uncharacterized protein n=3 Tax=Xanthomonas TaxID=338 RepID=A0A7Z7J2D7_XANCH|nr:hypothetical protein DGM98_10100 [Xanthomonas citri]SOO24929.1 hypothetical protein XFF6991_420146 [Xanthomonas phaseoli pv. phaseoli]
MQAMRFALATLSFAGRQLLLQSKLRVVAGRGFVQQRQAFGFTSTRIRSRSQSLSACIRMSSQHGCIAKGRAC